MKQILAFVSLLLLVCGAQSLAAEATPGDVPGVAARLDAPPYEPPAGWNRPYSGVVKGKPPTPPPQEPIVPKRVSEVEAMTQAEIKSWLTTLAPDEPVSRVEVEGDRNEPDIWLLGNPEFHAELGVCSLFAWPMRYDIVRQANSRRDDPLIRPTYVGGAIRYRPARTAAECNTSVPYSQWTAAGRPASYAAGFRRLREAVASVNSDGHTSLPIECIDWAIPATGACNDPVRLLARLRPELATEIWDDYWTYDQGYRGLPPVSDSWRLTIRDPADPGVTYQVKVKGVEHPSAIAIQPCMQSLLPPCPAPMRTHAPEELTAEAPEAEWLASASQKAQAMFPLGTVVPKRLSEVKAMNAPELSLWLHIMVGWRAEVETTGDERRIWIVQPSVQWPELAFCPEAFGEVEYRAVEAAPGAAADPLIQPYGVQFRNRYLFPPKSSPSCQSWQPRLADSIDATSARAIITAYRALYEARAAIGGNGVSRLPIGCGRSLSVDACKREALILKQLALTELRGVAAVGWSSPGRSAVAANHDPADAAWMLSFADPTAPKGNRLYLVTLKGVSHPSAVRVTRCVRPSPSSSWCAGQ